MKYFKKYNNCIYCGSSKLIFSVLENCTNKNNNNEFYLTDIVKDLSDKGYKCQPVLSNYSDICLLGRTIIYFCNLI